MARARGERMVPGSMSSIKRDVKRKSSASTGGREDFLSRRPAHCLHECLSVRSRGFALVCLPSLWVHLLMVTTSIEAGNFGKRVLVASVSTIGSIGGSMAYSYFWCYEGA